MTAFQLDNIQLHGL